MSKGKKSEKTLNTRRRQILSKKIGGDKLNEIEKLITEEVPTEGEILETPARKRLRKEIGEKELERIEARIISGEL